MGFFTINRDFIYIKAHYALFNAGCATVQPTMPVYAKVLGFSSFVVGTIYTILPLLGLIIKPAFGAIADKFKVHRGVLIACEVVVCIAYFGIWFIPPAHPNQPVELLLPNTNLSTICPFPGASPVFFDEKSRCNTTCTQEPSNCVGPDTFDFCSFAQSSPIFYINSTGFNKNKCGASENGDCTFAVGFDEGCQTICNITCKIDVEDDDDDSIGDTYSQWQFWVFLVLLTGAWCGSSVITTMSDMLCIEICGDPHLYGKQRLWGSAGWGVLVVINGLIIDAVSTEGEEKNYAPAFYIMLVPFILDFYLSTKLKVTIPEQSQNMVKDIWRVMLVPRNFVFMIWCGMFGVGLAILWNFVFWLLEDLAAARGPDTVANIKTIEGLVSGLQCFIGEVPAFFFGGWVVSKVGHYRAMTIVFAAIGLRYTLYSILVDPWWCMPIEFLQTNFALFYSAMTSYAKEIAPPGTEATVQSILCAVCEGIGVAIGSFVGGLLYDTYGGSDMMLMFGIAFFILAVLNEIIMVIFNILERRHKERELTEGNSNAIVDHRHPD